MLITARILPCSFCNVSRHVFALSPDTVGLGYGDAIVCVDCHEKIAADNDSADVFAGFKRVFFIQRHRLPDMEKAFARLQKRARKLSLAEPTYTILNEFFETHTVPADIEQEIPARKEIRAQAVVLVDPKRSRVKVDGYTFIGIVEASEHGALLRAVPGESIPAEYRKTSTDCDHCHTDRKRNQVYILRDNQAGFHESTHIQVGRTCLRVFFGEDGLTFANMADYLSSIDEVISSMGNDGASSGGKVYSNLLEYLEHVAECIAQEGWRSRRTANEQGGTSTSDIAERHMTGNFPPKYRPLYKEVSEKSKGIAAGAMTWASELPDDSSDFLWNLHVLAKREVISHRDMGLAAAMLVAHDRELAKARGRMNRPVSEYVGTVDEKHTATVYIGKIIACDTDFGRTYLHISTDMDGNQIKWFSSIKMEEKAIMTVRGKVKRHSVYAKTNEKETILTRVSPVSYETWYSPSYGLITAENEKEAKAILRAALGAKKLSKSDTLHAFSA